MLAVAFLLFSAQSLGSDWVIVANDKNHSRGYYIDASSIRLVSGRKYSYWVKEVIAEPSKDKSINMLSNVSEIKYNYIEDCGNSSSKLQGKTIYNDSGESYTFPTILYSSFEFEPIVPDTVGESFYKFVCEDH